MRMPKMPEWLSTLLVDQRTKYPGDRTEISDDIIPEGQRNSMLTSLAGTMRARGMTQEAIEAALFAENDKRCNPPLEEEEVRAIVRSIRKYNPRKGLQQDAKNLTTDEIISRAGFNRLKKKSGNERVEEVLQKLADLMNGVSKLRRMTIRNIATARLEKIGIRSPARLVDAAIEMHPAEEKSEQGQVLILTDPEPWPEPVDANALISKIRRFLLRFIVLPKRAATTIALWVLHTYALDAADISPILAIVSPEKRCGKTRLLGILQRLVRKPLPTANITPAALFRTIQQELPTLLIDEADSFLARNDELRGVLNSGHGRDAAVVIRTVGENHESRTFSTWCPKAIALIGKLPETLEDRAIVLAMRRKTPEEKVERFRAKTVAGELEILRRQAARWVSDHLDVLREADPEVPEALNDRAQDNWRSLKAIADAAGGIWPKRARKAATVLSGKSNEEENSASGNLLSDLRGIFEQIGARRLRTERILKELVKIEESPWAEWMRGNPLSANQLAKILRKYGIRPRQLWMQETSFRGYELDDFQDAFRRYLPPS